MNKPDAPLPNHSTHKTHKTVHKTLPIAAIYMGVLAAFVGYAASFAIVLAGLKAAGATDHQAATGLFFATLGMGVASIWLPLVTRIPAAVAWSTPGAAFLAAGVALSGGFAEAVGALIFCATLIFLTGLIPILGKAVVAIPKPIASALLAGVLVKLCFAPALALAIAPLPVAAILFAWVIALSWKKLAAMPAAIMAMVLVLVLMPGEAQSPDVEASLTALLPTFDWIMPSFSWQSAISIGLPLYLVTMAGQNIPGFAVLELNGYQVDRQPLLRRTGFISLLIAPFGAIPVNMSAITAAMMVGEDAGADRQQRFWAAVTSGVCYVLLAFAAGIVTYFVARAPIEIITSVAGLALVPALIASLTAAFGDAKQLEAPALTFLIAASGMTLLSISGAFWAIVVGALIWTLKALIAK